MSLLKYHFANYNFNFLEPNKGGFVTLFFCLLSLHFKSCLSWLLWCLRMRFLQLALRSQWDHVDQSQLVEWSPVIRQDLSWWIDRDRLELGISLGQVSPQVELWSDASDGGWGAHLDEQVASGLWAPEEVELSINARELLTIERALLWFAPHLVGSSVAVFADNSTAISYLRNQGGTHSSFLNSIAQRILRWAEVLSVVISPQFIMGKHNVLADALSRPNQILGSEWTLKQEVFGDLCRRWPVSIDWFATFQNHRFRYIFLLTTITMLWGRIHFFKTGMGGRHMPFLLGHSFRRF